MRPIFSSPARPTLPARLLTRSAVTLLTGLLLASPVFAQSARNNVRSSNQSSPEFTKQAQRLRESAISQLGPRVQTRTYQPSTATTARGKNSGPDINYNNNTRPGPGKYPWKRNIITTVFWVGEKPTPRNPTPNHASSWDPRWAVNFGGYDNPDPKHRNGFLPARFTPRQNPFYIALPYNDVTRGTTKPESRFVIPWFKREFQRVGRSVCKGRWVAIRKGNRVAYAQWEDCGPFRTDHWQYVFGKERPRPNINGGAALDVSPAVRDYLGMSNKDVTDWKFVEFHEVPYGPWSRYGENNTFVQRAREGRSRVADRR